MPRTQISPLRNISIRTVVDDVDVIGRIVAVWPNDMVVVITSPVSGLGTELHVPHFAMYRCNWLATFSGDQTTAMTARGQRRAVELLTELYAHSQGHGSGWPVHVHDDHQKEDR